MNYTLTGRYIQVNIASSHNTNIELKLFLNDQEFTQRLILSSLSSGKFYETHVSQLFLKLLEPGDTVIDIGAHVGYYSILSSYLVGASGRVIACEMNRDNFIRLCYHKDLNNCNNLIPIAGAIGDELKEVTFFINQDNDGGHALWNVGEHFCNQKSLAEPKQEKVTMRTLDEIVKCHNLDRVKLIKIDTEGAEPLVLKGGQESIAQLKVPFIISEINEFGLNQLGFNQMSVRKFFYDMGYSCYLILPNGLTELAPTTYHPEGLFDVLFSKVSI